MKMWGKVRVDNSTVDDAIIVIHAKTAKDVEDWSEPFAMLCHKLNLSRPVILKKHIRDLEQFSHVFFLPADFIEPVSFDKFEVELY